MLKRKMYSVIIHRRRWCEQDHADVLIVSSMSSDQLEIVADCDRWKVNNCMCMEAVVLCSWGTSL